jgi:hypothetical protein
MKIFCLKSRSVILIFIVVFFAKCEPKAKINLSNWQSFNSTDLIIDRNIDSASNAKYKFNDIEFEIVNEDNLNIEGYRIGLVINKLIYVGDFNNRIIVKNVPILIAENPLETYVTLSVWIIDERKKRLAVFTEKNPFFIEKAKRITFRLKSSFKDGYGNCKISIEQI